MPVTLKDMKELSIALKEAEDRLAACDGPGATRMELRAGRDRIAHTLATLTVNWLAQQGI